MRVSPSALGMYFHYNCDLQLRKHATNSAKRHRGNKGDEEEAAAGEPGAADVEEVQEMNAIGVANTARYGCYSKLSRLPHCSFLGACPACVLRSPCCCCCCCVHIECCVLCVVCCCFPFRGIAFEGAIVDALRRTGRLTDFSRSPQPPGGGTKQAGQAGYPEQDALARLASLKPPRLAPAAAAAAAPARGGGGEAEKLWIHHLRFHVPEATYPAALRVGGHFRFTACEPDFLEMQWARRSTSNVLSPAAAPFTVELEQGEGDEGEWIRVIRVIDAKRFLI